MNYPTIHPFPARMAPEIALEHLKTFPKTARILDPMMGSGTVLHAAAREGLLAIGYDLDPLAVLISRVWTTAFDHDALFLAAEKLIQQAEKVVKEGDVYLPWIDDDKLSIDFINFWFGAEQKKQLRPIAYLLAKGRGPLNAALKVVLSRLIITKKKGASLAGDVSHSRPHRIRASNDFDVFFEFIASAKRMVSRLKQSELRVSANAKRGDSRLLRGEATQSIDGIITSPPYLNAIDYMRGHKLSLIWLGFTLQELTKIRSDNIGTMRGIQKNQYLSLAQSLCIESEIKELSQSEQKMVLKYAIDINSMMKSSSRVLKKDGRATYIVGNSYIRGIYIDNASIVKQAAARSGMRLNEEYKREILASRRYLPPPASDTHESLRRRMGTESIMTFSKI